MISAGPDEPFRVLVVCAANRFRSPLTEHMLRHAFDGFPGGWEFHSAGVRAIPGEPVNPWVENYLREGGVPIPPDWRSRQLSPSVIDSADLILTAEEEHRRAVVLMSPSALRRTFLLLQFARLADARHASPALTAAQPPDGTGPGLLEGVLRARTMIQPTLDEDPPPGNVAQAVLRAAVRSSKRIRPSDADPDSLPDPAFKSTRVLTQCANRIEEAVIAMARAAAPTNTTDLRAEKSPEK